MMAWKFGKGVLVFASLVAALALFPTAPVPAQAAPATSHHYSVSIDRIGKVFVAGHPFVGSYTTTVMLSNGSRRTIKLTPMMHEGTLVARLSEGGMGPGTFMGPMGSRAMTINGNPSEGMLMVQLRTADYPPAAWKWVPPMRAELKDGTVPNPATTRFVVSLYEVTGEDVFAQDFTRRFGKTVTMADGSRRTISLTSASHDGRAMLKLDDNGRVAWLAPDAVHLDDGLMIQTRDMDPFVALVGGAKATAASIAR